MNTLNRRTFLLTSAGAAAAAAVNLPARLVSADAKPPPPMPAYLKGYETLYRSDPRAAARQWFREAKFGLFLHYGLYSLEGRHEWLQYREKIPVAKYAKLKDRFTAEKFNADVVTDLAVAAGMRYVNITTRHHDSFCLFATNQSDFNSVNSPARRDLICELAEACARRASDCAFTTPMGATGGTPMLRTTTVGAAMRGRNTIRPSRRMRPVRSMISSNTWTS